jgi:hypothetical protein
LFFVHDVESVDVQVDTLPSALLRLQVHETWVHRFITTATVEENVARLGAERAQELPEPSAIAVGSKNREATRLTVR